MKYRYTILIVLLAMLAPMSCLIGATGIRIDEAFADPASASGIILWNLRLPRLLSAIIVGGSLAAAGSVLQSLFRNGLAAPGIIGTSGGAGLGALLVIFFSTQMSLNMSFSQYILPLGAFFGAIGATLLIYRLSQNGKFTDLYILLIGGMAINIFCSAAIGFLLFLSDDFTLRSYTFWTLGDLSRVGIEFLLPAMAAVALIHLFLFRQSAALNLMATGEDQAYFTGVNTEKVKRRAILLIAVTVGVSVSISGVIGFVGLMVPHLIRRTGVSDQKHVFLQSLLAGPVLLIVADIISRTLIIPREIPVGIVTSFIGAPYLVYVLLKSRDRL